MKRVYLAEDLRLSNRNCALAEMIDTFSDDQPHSAAITAFQREARILASLDHPNIPKVLDAFSENHRHYLITEFVPGSTLEDILVRRGGKLSHDEVRAPSAGCAPKAAGERSIIRVLRAARPMLA